MFIKYFGIENFKVFSKFTEFEFAPITVLTGKNNSGKSSLIKALQLSSDSSLNELKFNDESGEFDNCLSWDSHHKKMSFAYNLNPIYGECVVKLEYENGKLSNISLFNREDHKDILVLKNFSEENEKNDFEEFEDGVGYYNTINTYLNFNVNWDFSYFITKYYTNLTQEEIKKKEENIFLSRFSGQEMLESAKRLNNPFKKFSEYEDLFNVFWSNFNKNDTAAFNYLTVEGNKIDIENNSISKLKKIENKIIKGEGLYRTLIRTFEHDQTQNHFGENLFLYLINSFINQLSLEIDNSLINNLGIRLDMSDNNPLISFFSEIRKIHKVKDLKRLSTVRSSSKRVFLKSSQESEIERLAFEVANIEKPNHKEKIIQFVNQSFESLEIDAKLIIPKKHEQVATSVKLEYNGKELNIVDFGFGYAQLIPVLLKIVVTANQSYDEYLTEQHGHETYADSCIVLEEPEANLHPNLQAQLAVVIVNATKLYNIQFIIETHSEYFIRKLQLLTAKQEINPEDSVIYYFNNPLNLKKGEKQVKKIKIRKDGIMDEDFGSGFFDEASNLTFDLLKIQNLN